MFRTYKNKFLRKAIVISAIFAVAAALAVTGVLLLVLKLCGVDFAWWAYLLIAVGVALVSDVALFLVLRPNDREVAKKLDEDFALGERIQTMVEFDGKEGAILELQRQDAEKRLGDAPRKKISLGAVLKIAALPVLACAIFFTAVFVPAKADDRPPEELPPEEEPYEFDTFQQKALYQLIQEVESSSLRDDLKAAEAAVLNDLLEGLKQTQETGMMKVAVRSAMAMVSDLTAAANSYAQLSAAMSSTERFSDLGTALTACAATYKNGSSFTEFEQVQQKETELYDRSFALLTAWAEARNEAVTGLGVSAFLAELRAIIAELDTVLAGTDFDETDGLVRSLSDLDAALVQTTKMSGNLKVPYAEALGVFADDGAVAMSEQSYGLMMDEYVRGKLKSIFNLNDEQSTLPDGDNGGSDSDDPSEEHGGGMGSGDKIYGSDDVIFYPDDGTYVQYGEVLNLYYAKVQELMARGDLSEELLKTIEEYFNMLWSGIEESTTDGSESEE